MKMMLAGVTSAALIQATLFAQVAMPPNMDRHRPEMKPITKAEAMKLVADQFAAVDLNHDGKVTLHEIETARKNAMDARRKAHRDKEFAMIDANHDGTVSKAEFETPPQRPDGAPDGPPPPGGPGKGPMGEHGMRGHGSMGGPGMGHPGMAMLFSPRTFDKVDANHDGVITLAEAQAAAGTWFDKIDANHDGTITGDEMRGMWMHRGPDGPGHRGPGGPGDDMPPPPPQR